MVELVAYTATYREEVLAGMADFFGFHASLVCAEGEEGEAGDGLSETLDAWTARGHELFVILYGGGFAGFLHIGYRGASVAWIEDVYVVARLRGRGVASGAIGLAEGIVAAKEGYSAVCMDVAPRNRDALRLYHRLGYDSLSLITLRKEFHQNGRDREADFLGQTFRY